MPLDAICLAAVKEELSRRITGLKIDKVHQPERDVIILLLRGAAGPCSLLISAGAGDARVHLTRYRFENPPSPPMFCMLLRKHLTGARIVEITQPRSERIVEFSLAAIGAMGELSEKKLTIELIGRASNIILTDSDGIIIDALYRIGGDMSGKRSVLPGLIYRPPPIQEGKLDPFGISHEKWAEIIMAGGPVAVHMANTGTCPVNSPAAGGATGETFNGIGALTEKRVDKWLLETFTALSPLICRELSWRAYGEADFCFSEITDGGRALGREFFMLMRQAENARFEPWLISDPGNVPRDFSYTRIMQYECALDVIRASSFSDMLDGFYTRSAQIHRTRQRAAAMNKSIKTARDRIIRKQVMQREELKKTAGRDSLRKQGDIITANLHQMKKGSRVLAARDFYGEEGAVVEIALDPLKTPQQNAAKYYKAYTKAKKAEKFLTEQLIRGDSELEYLESVLEALSIAEGERDLLDIRRELIQTGYIKAGKTGKAKKEKAAESFPMEFESSTGFRILVGRNNSQNDLLTHKTAAKTDIWLHGRKVPGAHVVISCGAKQPDEGTLYEAAAIAAYYSAARSGGRVPVDHTLVKHVKRQPGGRPGMVFYTDYKTIIAAPDEQLVTSLRRS